MPKSNFGTFPNKHFSAKWLVIGAGAILLAALFIIFFFAKRAPGQLVPVTPSKLAPFVSASEARANICARMNDGLFAEACRAEYDSVAKNDAAKISTLFLLIKKIGEDKSLSDYDRLLLAQAIFPSLPGKDSPLAHSEFSRLIAKLKNFINEKNVAYAEESNANLGMGDEAFRKMMLADLKKVVGDLPQGNNAYVVNVMVSKHQWINGVRQPIYADQYAASYDPFPGVSTEPKDQSKISYNVRSVVGSRATSQTIYDGPFKGTGEMMSYSFSIMSWESPPYGKDSVLVVAEAGPDAKDLTSRQNRSEEGYQGENILSDLLSQVPMPPRQQAVAEAKKDEPASAQKEIKPGDTISESEVWDIAGTPDCPIWTWAKGRGLYCFKNETEMNVVVGNPPNLSNIFNYRAPSYPAVGAKPWEPPKSPSESEQMGDEQEVYTDTQPVAPSKPSSNDSRPGVLWTLPR